MTLQRLIHNRRLKQWYWRAYDSLQFWKGKSILPARRSLDSGQPRATIIIPLLNQIEDWLRQSIESALHQTVPCQVIVITSPSTNELNQAVLRQLQSNSNLEVCMQRRPGFAGALNTGIGMARADRVGFLLSDDWLASTAVEECVRFSADIVCSGLRTYAADGTTEFPAGRIRLSLAEFEHQPTIEQKARYLQHFFLFQKRKLEEVGGVDEALGDWPGVDDYDLIWVLLEHGATVSIVNKFLYNYRDHSRERLTLRRKEEALANLAKLYSKHRLPLRQRRELLTEYGRWLGKPIQVVQREAPRFQPHGQYVKTAGALQPFLDAGFSQQEYFEHHVWHDAEQYPDSLLVFERRGMSRDVLHKGTVFRLNLYAAGPPALVESVAKGEAASATLFVADDSAFVGLIESELWRRQPDAKFKYWHTNLFNAVMDFALDVGVLTVHFPTGAEVQRDFRAAISLEQLQEIYDSVGRRYISTRTRVQSAEYWRISVHENAQKIVSLDRTAISVELATGPR